MVSQVYERIETLSVTRQHTLRHTRGKGGDSCTTTSIINLSVSESSMYQQVVGGVVFEGPRLPGARC